MGTGLKTLVAITCIVVIAGVGYYFWGEYSAAQRDAARQAATNAAEEELFQLAGASRDRNPDKVRYFCSRFEDNESTSEPMRQVLKNCRALGYL